MPYLAPTPTDLKMRFPAFAGVPDPVIQGALDEAGGRVDLSWREVDYQPAMLLYAAHVMTLDGLGTGAEAEAAKAGMGGFKSFRSGQLSLDRGSAGSGSSAGAGGLASTSYGARFLALLRFNHPPVLVV